MPDPITQQQRVCPLVLPDGLPGRREARSAELVRGSGRPFMSLRVDDWRLPVAVPWDVNPEFGYRFDDADTAGLGEPRDWTIVCVATLPKPGRANGTINFFAPIVVNEKTGVAAQIENRAGGYSTREPFTLAVAS